MARMQIVQSPYIVKNLAVERRTSLKETFFKQRRSLGAQLKRPSIGGQVLAIKENSVLRRIGVP
jgi:hypothetical protein